MDSELEIQLAKREAIKRFRSAVRLEMSIAADYVIGRRLPQLESLIDREIATNGLPALEAGVGSKAKQIADILSSKFEEALDQLELEA